MEINPDHPVTRKTHDQWHKICALLMQKFGVTDVKLTESDIAKLGEFDGKLAVVIEERATYLRVRIVSMEEGERLAKQEGGLPS